MITDNHVRLLRQRAQRLTPQEPDAPTGVAQVVKDLCGLQAQDASAAALAVRVRSTGLFNDDVERPVSSRDRANHVLIGPERIRRRPFRQIADLVEFCGKTTIQQRSPFAEEKELTADSSAHRINFVGTLRFEYEMTLQVMMQRAGTKKISCWPMNQFSY